ncbi:MAG: hypothetical protein ED557_00400 [Balneola sp.]|nr:MAG: hypothetical protein ED557_00400 [Balneola sp.]
MRTLVFLLGLMVLSPTSDIDTDSRLAPVEQIDQNDATVSGTIVLPAIQKASNNRFRGRTYRNRTSGDSSTDESSNSSSNFSDVIISAHPISFTVETTPLEEPAQVIQKDAVFIPRVTAVTVGSTVQFVNDDPFFHNVFSLTPGARFNIGRRPKGDVYSKVVPELNWRVEGIGPISIYCDIHSQMNAIVLSLDTPYFTRANDDGTFQLDNLPPGEYEIRAYHPRFSLLIQEITVSVSESKSIVLEFS